MAGTIDEIINVAQQHYQLNVTQTNRPAISSFLEWFLSHHSYDLSAGKKIHGHTPVSWMMVDVALMHSYLCGERSVRKSVYNDNTSLIKSNDDLPFLRSRGDQHTAWSDNNLYTLYIRRERHAIAHSLPRYKPLFDMVAAYPPLIERWGKQLRYAEDVAVKRGGKFLNRVVR